MYLSDEEAEIFRENVRIYSAVKGITNAEYGEKLEVVPHEVSQIIAGDRYKHLPYKVANKISKVIGVDLDELLLKTPLNIPVKIKEFLQHSENISYINLLIDCKKEPYFLKLITLDQKVKEFILDEEVTNFLKYEKNRKNVMELIRAYDFVAEYKKNKKIKKEGG